MPNWLFQEDTEIILNTLTQNLKNTPFTVLFCDEIASQSGRIIDVKKIYEWAKQNNVVLVVDGT